MKKKILHIITLLALSLPVLTACVVDYTERLLAFEEEVTMKLTLNLPSGASQDAQTRAAAHELEAERRMDVNGLHLLIFEDNILKEDVNDKQLSAENDNGQRVLTAKTEGTYKNSLDVVVLVNMHKNKINFNSALLIGQTKANVYNALKYTYGTNPWNVEADAEQYIPMWGQFSLTPTAGTNQSTVSLYRAVSKINVIVNEKQGLDNFTLTSARVYFANQQGYAAPLTQPLASDPVANPSVDDSFTQSNASSPLVYQTQDGILENKIYVPEVNNTAPTQDKRALCLVVGGHYKGAGLVDPNKESFYRIEFKDESGVYDALRNHLYLFNIKSVSSPGTPTPEDALVNAVVGMKVSIEAWNETVLNGLSSQHSLATDKSRVSFVQAGGQAAVTISSDYPWSIVTDNNNPAWFTATVSGNQVILSADANYSTSRNGYFYIESGRIKKQIFVEQAQPETSNCYLVGPGTHKLSVTIKGNGTAGLKAENKDGSLVELDKTAELKPAYLKVIWETERGLVTLLNANGSLTADKADYDEHGRLTYVVKNDPMVASINMPGGNALIGAFDEQNNVIWSWHIWVSPEMAAQGSNGDEGWTMTGYTVMDRNLGALSNKPGVGSLGLLYQWGRKDPFIGAAAISENAERLATVNHLPSAHDWKVGQNNANETSIAFTIANPTKLIHGGLSVTEPIVGQYLWGTNGGLNTSGIKELGVKTIYDPCPAGYRIPPVDAFVFKTKVTYKHNTYNNLTPPAAGDTYTVDEWSMWNPATARVTYANVYVRQIGDKGLGHYYKEIRYLSEDEAGKYELRHVLSYTVEKSSEKYNWQENLVYIPFKGTNESVGFFGPPDGDQRDYKYNYKEKSLTEAPFYGYYLNYKEGKRPKVKEVTGMSDAGTRVFGSELESYTNITWLPISGAYDPTNASGMTFKDVKIEQGSSLTVNSFLWTNSSVRKSNGNIEPAAMFLHGGEFRANADPMAGYHIHGLTKSDITARPDYAGGVRCVRDLKKNFGEDNKVPSEVSLNKSSNSSTEATIIAINESWQVVDPGAPWLSISPDRGAADKGKGSKIIFTAMSMNNSGNPRTTTVKIRFGASYVGSITVTQKAE